MGAVQTGTAALGTNASGKITFTVTFPSAFTTPPKVIVTVRNSTGDIFAANTTNISATAFDVILYRLDQLGGGWGIAPALDWIAIE